MGIINQNHKVGWADTTASRRVEALRHDPLCFYNPSPHPQGCAPWLTLQPTAPVPYLDELVNARLWAMAHGGQAKRMVRGQVPSLARPQLARLSEQVGVGSLPVLQDLAGNSWRLL